MIYTSLHAASNPSGSFMEVLYLSLAQGRVIIHGLPDRRDRSDATKCKCKLHTV
jgi:hypothetical protein